MEVPGPTRDHTERILAAAGVPIRREGLTTVISGPSRPNALTTTVPGDISSAAAWLVAGALHPEADITLTGVGLNPTRAALVELLQRAGADVRATVTATHAGEPLGDIEVRGGRPLGRIEVAGDEVAALIDELPLVGGGHGRGRWRAARRIGAAGEGV